MVIGKIFTFHSAHQLPDEPCYGKCANLHGHTYRLVVEIQGDVTEKGWVMNFSDIGQIVRERVINKLDHAFLNDIVTVPTAENILLWIFEELKDILAIYRLTLYETETSFAQIAC